MLFEQFILNEYNAPLMNKLVAKFKVQKPDLQDSTIINYIERFKRYKDHPQVTQKDIMQYDWKELERVIDSLPLSRKEQLGTVAKPSITGATPIYNKNGIRAFVGTDKKSCLTLGNGHKWCISARGDGNMYHEYRHTYAGTPYFVFNDNLSSEVNEDGSFADPKHAVVVFFYNREIHSGGGQYKFTVSDADNKGDTEYKDFDHILQDYSFLLPLKSKIVHVEPPQEEKQHHEIRKSIDKEFNNIKVELDPDRTFTVAFDPFYRSIVDVKLQTVKDVRSGKLVLYKFRLAQDKSKPIPEGFDEGDFEIVERNVVLDSSKLEQDIQDQKDRLMKDMKEELWLDTKLLPSYKIVAKPSVPTKKEHKELMDTYYQKCEDLIIKMNKQLRGLNYPAQ